MIRIRRANALLGSALVTIGVVVGLGVGVGDSPAGAATTGPPLDVPAATLQKALTCSGPLAGATHDPVLLTPAFSTGPQSYGFNYEVQLPAAGITTCTLTLPDRGYGDLQVAAEYDVAAIRTMAAQSHRQVVLLGHQHGALDGLWALKFWPDLAGKVSDFISLATPYHGTSTAAGLCGLLHRCPPSVWQISTGSKFLAALNAAPLPAGPSYTSIATAYDEFIVPQPATSTLSGAANIQLQSICPGRPIEHFTILADNLTYRLVLDAVSHRGPAAAARIPASVCSGPLYMPAATTVQGATGALAGLAGFASGFTGNLLLGAVGAEPAVRSYAVAH